MSGHSKWHNIRLRKGKQDAVRGVLFTRLGREISIAAKSGGGSPDANPRLRLAIQKAKADSMPADKIKNAILRGTGEIEGANYEEITFEGYGPHGVAVIVQCATDNRNRTVADVRNIFSKAGGNLGENGSVAWMFNAPQGLIHVAADAKDEDKLIAVALDAGAEDVKAVDDGFEVYTSPGDLPTVVDAVSSAKFKTTSAEITMIPNNMVTVDGKTITQIFRLLDKLEENDDVQRVYSNFDAPDDVMEQAAS